jgi:predicted nucleic acid-binding protein
MARRIDAYVDTSALIAFVDRSDTHHALFRRLFANPPVLLTSTLVIAELHGWFLRRYGPTRALDVLAMIDLMTPLTIHGVGKDEQDAAFGLLRRFSDQRLTLADAVGLHLMQALDIPNCWSTDFHLGLTGVPLVIHAH